MKHYEITVHEFGKQNSDVIVMFHPLGVWWDVFDRVILVRFSLVVHEFDEPEFARVFFERCWGRIADAFVRNHAFLRQSRAVLSGYLETASILRRYMRPAFMSKPDSTSRRESFPAS